MVGGAVAVFAGSKVRTVEKMLPASVAQESNQDGRLTLRDFEYRDVKQGNVRWTMWAAKAIYFEDKKETELEQVKATFFLKKGGQVELTGDKGVLYTDTDNMEIRDNVVVSYGDGYQISTDRLFYEREKDLISTESKLVVKGGGFTLKGRGMLLHVAERKVSILTHTETTLKGVVSFGGQRQRVS
jgi:LPS export ABC transporter protein LptC